MKHWKQNVPVQLTVPISCQNVQHFLGYPEQRSPRPRQAKLIQEAIADARTLVDPRGIYCELEPERSCDLGLEFGHQTALVAGLVTIGHHLEQQVTSYLERDLSFKALVLDAAGSAAVEEAADRLGAFIVQDDDNPTKSTQQCRLSPGYGRFPLEAQKQLFRMLPHQSIGVHLTKEFMMVPQKSISFVLLLGEKEVKTPAGLSGCRHCGMTRCRYRRQQLSMEMESEE